MKTIEAKAKHAAYMLAWYYNNREKVRSAQKAYYERNREKIGVKVKEYRLANPQKVSENHRRWRLANHEYTAKTSREWRANNREKSRAVVRKSEYVRERRIGMAGPSDLIDLATLIERDRGICGVCHTPVRERPSVDHIKPVALGGAHTWDNVQLAHTICNQRRGMGVLPAQMRLAI